MNGLQKSLEDIYNAMPKNDSFFNCMDKKVYNNDKYQKKLNNAIESYVGWDNMSEDESYLFLFDDTIFGSAKDGFLITTKAIYYKEQMENPQKELFSDITSISIKSVDKIVIDATMINLTLANLDRDSIVKILNVLKDYNNISKDDLLVEKSITISAEFASSGGVYPEAINGHEIKIPADTTDGKRWRYEGLGNTKLGVCGDLIIAVTVEASEQELKKNESNSNQQTPVTSSDNLWEQFQASNKNPTDSQELELTLETPPETSPQQTNPSDLKTQYANKIASGEIDPIETSFADFEAASKNKEIDYKAVYSQMISEGRINPTETTYDEMILVSKLFGGVDESEYKTTYSKYIGSGKIDPSETTYGEIVSIAKIFNEINGGDNSKDMMEEIYQYLMKNVNDDNADIVGDFLELKDSGECWVFCNFTREMYAFKLDFEKIKYLLDRSYELAQDYVDYKDIANTILDYNSPDEWSEWAKELYKESESKVQDVGGILDLAYSIDNTLEDDDWALNLYERAMNKSNSFRDMISTADAVAQSDSASKTWAKEIYQKAKDLAEEFEDYQTLTDNVSHDMYLGDKDWGKELFEEAKEKATEVSEFQALIELLISEDNFNDQEYGKKLSYEALDKCNDFEEYLQIVRGTSENQELQKEIILKMIVILETDEEKNKLCDEIEYSLEDDDQLKIDIQNLSVQELKTKYGKPSTEELKKLYAQGIGSGEIDPVEVSFDSFEKNYKA